MHVETFDSLTAFTGLRLLFGSVFRRAFFPKYEVLFTFSPTRNTDSRRCR